MCNLNCRFCHGTKRPGRMMSRDEFGFVAGKLQGRADNYYLHIMGEPTSHPELSDILKTAQKYNMPVNITTNGTLIDRAGDIILKTPVRSVSFSLHSFDGDRYGPDMDSYLDKICSFCLKASEAGIICELRLWNFGSEELNQDDNLNAVITKQLSDKLSLDYDLKEKMLSEFKDREKDNSRRINTRLRGNIFLSMAEYFEWPDTDKPDMYQHGFCYGLRNQVGVLSDGTVIACCLDGDGRLNLGNIFTDDFDDIISSQRARAIYDGFTDNRPAEHLCRTCGYMAKYYEKKYKKP